MTFQQLTYVVEISRCGSINKAAHKLFLSQSGISTAVRELEEELGIQFFVRSNRGVEFTPEGKEFLSYAMSLLEQKQRIESLYGEGRNAAAPVRFSVSTQRYPFTEDAFLRMLRTAEDNRYRYSIKETGMDAVIDDVYDHRADVGIIFLTELTEKMIRRLLDARELDFHEVAAVAPCVYLRKGHPLAGRPEVTESDLEGYPYVSFEHAQGVAADFSEEYPELTLKRPDRCISVNNRATMMNVLAQTDAFTTGSGLLVESVISQAVVTVPLAAKSDVRIGWIAPRGRKPSPQIESFVRLLEASVADSIRFTQRLHQSLAERN
ncbi:LysR family transcriptional regulator [uncultured Dysosmobacter sp.]|uniref:LysR family transcriptional regulator n=1 Tax=uncultured Dysosmobacter sp. TaxID=2591384 RepID=UPI00262FC26E|nr:LysR family transcriptional regulator [uncultured Dysosmobacter sp.]